MITRMKVKGDDGARGFKVRSRRMLRFLRQFPKVKALMRESIATRPMDHFFGLVEGTACGCIFRDGGWTDRTCCLEGHVDEPKACESQ